MLAVGVLLAVIGGYHFLAGWKLKVDETEALVIATRTVGFPVGHASAQLAWYGLRSRPAWRILLYSADEPPSLRGLVECDGVDGHVIGEYTETNPEDWSKFGLDEAAQARAPPAVDRDRSRGRSARYPAAQIPEASIALRRVRGLLPSRRPTSRTDA